MEYLLIPLAVIVAIVVITVVVIGRHVEACGE